MNWQMLTNLFSNIANVTVIVGLPLGFYQLIRVVRGEKKSREDEAFHATDEKYIEFLQLCIQHPYLNIFDIPDDPPFALDQQQKKQELIAYAMLLSIFERSYLMYYEQDDRVKKAQWSGWDRYIHEYCERENLQSAWRALGGTYDTRFEQYMNNAIQTSTSIKLKQSESLLSN